MLRHRTIAAAPVRGASATWQVITGRDRRHDRRLSRAVPGRSRAGHVGQRHRPGGCSSPEGISTGIR